MTNLITIIISVVIALIAGLVTRYFFGSSSISDAKVKWYLVTAN